MERINYKVDKAESRIFWLGKKVTGSHNGTIDILEGVLTMDNGELAAGEIIVDTRSIKILDITDPDTNQQFAGHLVSEDFFASGEFPTATLTISKVSKLVNTNYHIAADLTIKGITNPIEFDAEIGNTNTDTLKASGKLVIDRTRYNMKFRSGHFFQDLGDALIYDDFTLKVQLIARVS
jgi:polyisoprenoid-binding protein YceI